MDDFSVASAEALVEQHRLDELRRMTEAYNSLPYQDDNSNFYKKYHTLKTRSGDKIPYYSDPTDYVFAFWMRGVSIPEELGFGEHIDRAFSHFSMTSDPKTGELVYDLNRSPVYRSLKLPRLALFQLLALDLDWTEVDNLNDILKPVGFQLPDVDTESEFIESMIEILNKLNDLELLYLAWSAYDYDIDIPIREGYHTRDIRSLLTIYKL